MRELDFLWPRNSGPPTVQMGFAPGVLINLKDDSMPRLGVGAQDLTWLSRAIEKGQHGHTRAQTGAD